jgi:hypothetical protein
MQPNSCATVFCLPPGIGSAKGEPGGRETTGGLEALPVALGDKRKGAS